MDGHARVLLIDDDSDMRRIVERALGASGFAVESFESAQLACQRLGEIAGQVDAILTDLRMPGMDGIAVVNHVKARWPELPVVMMTGEGTIEAAVEAIRLGAYDFLQKPFDSHDVLKLTMQRAVDHLRLTRAKNLLEGELQRIGRPTNVVGESARIRQVFQLVSVVAPTDATVLVLGESGTGKELVARALHEASARRARGFSTINCSALPDSLLESELFGYVAGAFTGARSNRMGLFEQASGGTLFLDEVGDISPAMQVRLLRVLQNGEIRPLGGNEVRRVDVRVVAATNRDLQAAMRAGTFREDLFFRLNVVSIHVPPLRERSEDLAALGQHFLRMFSTRFRKAVVRFDAESLDALARYAWPGNVRELENTVQRAVVLAPGDTVTIDLLPETVTGRPPDSAAPARVTGVRLPFAAARAETLNRFERGYLQEALAESRGNLARAARASQVDKSNFRRLVQRHGLDRRPSVD